jgi:hypothetical protein
LTYILPTATDPDNTTCTIALVSGPTFATFSTFLWLKRIFFNPGVGTAGTYLVTVSITDGFNVPHFTFNVIVRPNSSAIFVSTPID